MSDARPIVLDEEVTVSLRCFAKPGLLNSVKRMRVVANRVILPGFEEFQFVVHGKLNWSDRLKKMGIAAGVFTVSEATTGMRITFKNCRTEEEAAEEAYRRLQEMGITPEKVRRTLEEVKARESEAGRGAPVCAPKNGQTHRSAPTEDRAEATHAA